MFTVGISGNTTRHLLIGAPAAVLAGGFSTAALAVSGLMRPLAVVAQSDSAQTVRATRFELMGPDGTTRAVIGSFSDGPGIIFYGPDGTTQRVAIGTEDTTANAGVTLRDPAGVQRAPLGVNPAAGGAGLTLDYPDGQTPDVTVTAPSGAGEGRVTVRDSDGQAVATLP